VFSGTKIVILDLKYKVMEGDVLNKKARKNSSVDNHRGSEIVLKIVMFLRTKKGFDCVK
jgi:hypothetical protein